MKRRTERNRLRERGLTMIEMMIALALVGFVFVMVFNFNDFGVKIFNKSKTQSQNQSDVRIPVEFVSKELRFADSVTILTGIPASHVGDEFYIENGQIKYYKNGSLTSIPGTESVSDFKFSVTKVSGNMLQIVVGKAGTTEYDVTTQVEALNIGVSGISGTVGAPALGLRFTQNAVMSSGSPTLTSVDTPLAPATVQQYSIYVMPSTAIAHFSDGSTGYLPIHWNSTVVTDVPGTFTSTGTVLSYTVQQTVTVTPVGIASISPITGTAELGHAYAMPTSVLATMATSPVTTQMVPVVSWSPAGIDVSTVGSKTSLGTVAGYTPKVSLTVTVTLPKLPAPNVSKSGSDVTVTGTVGSTAYLLKQNGTVLQQQVLTTGTYTFIGVSSAKSVYLKKPNWLDSDIIVIP